MTARDRWPVFTSPGPGGAYDPKLNPPIGEVVITDATARELLQDPDAILGQVVSIGEMEEDPAGGFKITRSTPVAFQLIPWNRMDKRTTAQRLEDPDPEEIPGSESSPVWKWFGLTRASYFVIPRHALQSMPLGWQRRWVELMEEAGEELGHHKALSLEYSVQIRDSLGRYVEDPLKEYRHATPLERASRTPGGGE